MGSGNWSERAYCSYCADSGRTYDVNTCSFSDTYSSASQAFTQCALHEKLNPAKVIRECRDSEEHPGTVPVILALDVTGSMGGTAMEVQKKLNLIMQELYEKVADVEFMVMAIGDLTYDDAPIQISQFESDIRIAENLDHIYFEGGGGGNGYESYTAAWYMGARHTDLDCWKRGKKGLIITIGDETLNPYLPRKELERATGDRLERDVETASLYGEVRDKYDVYHVCIESCSYANQDVQRETFAEVIGGENVVVSSVADLRGKIVGIVTAHAGRGGAIVESAPARASKTKLNENGEITW